MQYISRLVFCYCIECNKLKLAKRHILSTLLHSVVQSGCTERDIRLVGGETDREGDVQICWQGVWGYVCGFSDDSNYVSGWTDEEARVVCQQLNYSTSCERLVQQ